MNRFRKLLLCNPSARFARLTLQTGKSVKETLTSIWWLVFGIGVVLFLAADSTLAQCVMCRASLSTNSSFIRNFNIGVLVLLVPPVTIFCVIFVLAIRHRRSG